MVGSQIMLSEKICSQNALFNVGDSKIKFESAGTKCKRVQYLAVTGYERPVRRRQLGAVGASTTLLGGWRNDRTKGASVHEPFVPGAAVCDVKEISLLPVNRVHVRGTGRPFGALFAC